MDQIGARAVVLAAGKSTRIAPVARNLPKPLLGIEGQSVLTRNLQWLARTGIEEVWINLHHCPEAIVEHIGDDRRLGLRVRYSYEPEILGTAGGVRRIAYDWSGAFPVVYGDSLIRTDLTAMKRAHSKSGALLTIALFDRSRHPHSGIAGGVVTINSAGRVIKFLEGAVGGTSTLVNAGLYIVEPEIISFIPPLACYDFARDLFPQMLNSGMPINSHIIDGYCLGIDTPAAYSQALRLIDEGMVKL